MKYYLNDSMELISTKTVLAYANDLGNCNSKLKESKKNRYEIYIIR